MRFRSWYGVGVCRIGPVLAVLSFALPASGQFPVDVRSKQGKDVVATLDDVFQNPGRYGKLQCTVTPRSAQLGFDFRMWAGYNLLLPLKQLGADATNLVIVLRVKPKDAEAKPVYLGQRYDLPKRPNTKGDIYLEGGFFLGPGQYEVDWFIGDPKSRVCRKQWSVKANPGKVDATLAPNTVTAMMPRPWRGFGTRGTESAQPERVTVFFHVAPVIRRRFVTQLSLVDRMILLGSLVSFLERSHFTTARLVAFDLDGRRVLFRSDHFDRAEYRKLVGVLNRTEFGTVDIKTLNSGPPPSVLIRQMVQEELAFPEASRAFVFLGPGHRLAGRLPQEFRERSADLPPTYYLTFTRTRMAPEDWIDRFVRKVAKGRVLPIAFPEDLAKAIEVVEERLRGL